MPLARIVNDQEITSNGQVSFHVVTKSVVFLQWENTVNEWITAKEFRNNELFSLKMETDVIWRFKIFDEDSYVESQI
jgi:hypothetical protein